MRTLLLNIASSVSAQLSVLLKQQDHAVDSVDSIEDAQAIVLSSTLDLVIIDLDKNYDEAIEFVHWIRVVKPALKVLVCKSRKEIHEIRLALSEGADDFVLKPIDLSELKFRILTLETRDKDNYSKGTVLEFGPLRVDLSTRQVWLEGRSLELTPRERSVLQVLLRHRGSVVSKEQIAARVFSMDDEAAPAAIEIYIHRLRRKIRHGEFKIKTVRGLGYQLELAAMEVSPQQSCN
ncbi:MAG: winged helix-turn-helix domain-containing protein [Hyphomicrobiaceae bacterium]